MGHTLNLMMSAASAHPGMQARRLAPSARSHRSRSGQFASSSIASAASVIVLCSTLQSTASSAAATWSDQGT